jgi:hypothetical protein
MTDQKKSLASILKFIPDEPITLRQIIKGGFLVMGSLGAGKSSFNAKALRKFKNSGGKGELSKKSARRKNARLF